MIVLFAGRRPSGADGAFPETGVAWLEERLERLFAGLRPRLAVGSAAAGADLLSLAAALRARAEVDLLLTEDIDAFVAASVADKGPEWVRAFQDLSRSPGVRLHPVAGASEDDDGFRAVNHALLDHARARLRADDAQGRNPEELVVVAVTGGRRAGEDHTESLADSAERLGHLVLRLDPSASKEASPTAFVAMPYGSKRDTTRELKRFEANETWNRVLVPALLDSGYRPIRTDLDSGLEAIDARMLHSINTADLFVADLATFNPNVLWELGVRHAWRRSGTLIMAPRWVTPPFDLGHATVKRYERGMTRVSDRQAVAAIRMLRPALTASKRGADSPVWAVFPMLEPVRLPSDHDAELISQLTRYTEEISLAADLHDVEQLIAIAARVRHNELPDTSRDALLEQIGLALVTLDRFEEGRDLLAPLAEADISFARVRMQQRYALTLIHRPGTPLERLPCLREAERRLRRLDALHPDSSETWGLLGSAAKRAFEVALHLGENNARHSLDRAIDAYRSGMAADPGDHYPGINAVALLRLRGQHFGGGQGDVAEAESLLPVVRFAVKRRQIGPQDTWEHASLAELDLHRHLLGGETEKPPAGAARHYAVAVQSADGAEISSMRRQLALFLAAGDPPAVIEPLLAAVRIPARGDCP
ncbi:TRAFs-binding domain-containing protein [Streptomyces sp. NPDC055189]